MNPHNQPSTPDLEERLEAWLTSQPLTPAPDFVARTLERVRAESALMVAAKAGDEAAIDALLDRWLGEQPLEPDFEPAQLATQTRRTAVHQEHQETETTEPLWRRIVVPFPAWVRSSVALAAAACVAFMAYFGSTGPGALTTNMGDAMAANNPSEETSEDAALPAHYAWVNDSKAVLQLSDSLSDGAALLDSDNVDVLFGNDQSDSESIN